MQKNIALARMLLRYAALTGIAGLLVVVFLKVPRVNQTTVALGVFAICFSAVHAAL